MTTIVRDAGFVISSSCCEIEITFQVSDFRVKFTFECGQRRQMVASHVIRRRALRAALFYGDCLRRGERANRGKASRQQEYSGLGKMFRRTCEII